jgi:hypothetical protein
MHGLSQGRKRWLRAPGVQVLPVSCVVQTHGGSKYERDRDHAKTSVRGLLMVCKVIAGPRELMNLNDWTIAIFTQANAPKPKKGAGVFR